jgi:hypothetical protein
MTKFTEWTWPSYTGGKSRTALQRLDQFGAVNAAEMPNFAGNGTTDDIIPLRAAVAKALADSKGAVIIPVGANCAISDTLGLWFEADHSNPAFSLALIGGGPHGNHEGYGSRIKPTFDGVGLMVGPGQEMLVENIAVVDTNANYRALQNSARVGIGIAGGSGGASGWSLNDCHVFGMYNGVQAGLVSGALCDSGYVHKLNIDNCVTGIAYLGTQNYIQNVDNCTISAKVAINAAQGHNINVRGGNYSGVSARAGKFTLSSVSAVTRTVAGTYTFTAHVDNPDANLIGSVLDDGCVDLPHFGLVPVLVTGYNSGTQVISLTILPMWGFFHYQSVNLKTATDFDTVNQANTTLYLAERMTTFQGPSFNVSGSTHLENPSGYTRLLDDTGTFDVSNHTTRISDLFCNYDVAAPFNSDADAQVAVRKVQKSHPFINLENGTSLILDSVRLSQTFKIAINIDILSGALQVKDCKAWYAPNIRSYSGQDTFTTNFANTDAPGTGAGIWQPTPFYSAHQSIQQRQCVPANRLEQGRVLGLVSSQGSKPPINAWAGDYR